MGRWATKKELNRKGGGRGWPMVFGIFAWRDLKEMTSSQPVRKRSGYFRILGFRIFAWATIWKGFDLLRVQKI